MKFKTKALLYGIGSVLIFVFIFTAYAAYWNINQLKTEPTLMKNIIM